MPSTLQLTIFLLSIIHLYCEQWYIPHSRMISDVEFKEHIMNDHSTYKLVKFFTPNCVYCRHLKEVIDQLKEEKQWSFQIYDLNCAWYPALCNNQIKATSFPFTAIFDQNGTIDEQIVGFYPYPVIRKIFQELEENSLIFKQKNKNQNHQIQPQNDTSKVVKNQQIVQTIQKQQIIVQPVQKQQIKPIIIQEQNKPQPQVIKQISLQKLHNSRLYLDGVSQHIFKCICILLGVIYFGNFIHFIKSDPSDPTITTIISNPELMSDIVNQQRNSSSKINSF